MGGGADARGVLALYGAAGFIGCSYPVGVVLAEY